MMNTRVSTRGVDGADALEGSSHSRSSAIADADDAAVCDDRLATLAAHEDKIANLERALVTNRRIGIAIGILMARTGHTDRQVFDTLRTMSQHRNRKLRDIAEDVIYTGALP